MLIQDYFYSVKESNQEGKSGNPDPAMETQWQKWKDSFIEGKSAFLDMPAGQDNRMIILSASGTVSCIIGFCITDAEIKNMPSLYAFYSALRTADPEKILASVSAQTSVELSIDENKVTSPSPVPPVFSDVNGLQMIGSTDKALLTVSRLLPQDNFLSWFRTYFLAVNPAAYSEEFTTVISDEAPEGEWLKLKSEHTEYATSFAFHQRRRTWIRHKLLPRFITTLSFAVFFAAAFLVTLVFAVKEIRRLRIENNELQSKNEMAKDQLRRSEDREKVLLKQIETASEKNTVK